MLINETEVQLSHEETREVSCLYGHIHFHGSEFAQQVADAWIAAAKDEDAKQRRQKATRAPASVGASHGSTMTITRFFGPAHASNGYAGLNHMNFMQQAAINEAAARGGAITLILRGADRMANWERYLPGVPRLTPSEWCERARDGAADIIVVDDLPSEMRRYVDKTLEAVEAEVWIYEAQQRGPRQSSYDFHADFLRRYGHPSSWR